MTPGVLCFKCREFTGRYDEEHRRWACLGCWPAPLGWERALVAARGDKPLARIVAPGPEARLPGETRQQSRRRMRGGER